MHFFVVAHLKRHLPNERIVATAKAVPAAMQQFNAVISAENRLSTNFPLNFKRDAKMDQFLQFISNPFRSQFTQSSIVASVGSSLGFSIGIFLLWCLIRPHNSVVYAPRLRHSDEKHAPPRLEKGLFGWVKPLVRTKEAELVDKIGEDAALFLRFLKMCRTIFFFLAVFGVLVIIPVNVVINERNTHNWTTRPTTPLALMTPQFAWGTAMYAHVIMAWVFDSLIMYFLYRNYIAVAKMRKNYFETEEYQKSLHSRTLMMTDVPDKYQSEEGLKQIIQKVNDLPSSADENYVIGRSVKGLPELIEEHENAVRKLEVYLAKYLKNPDRLPASRPTCSPEKGDKSVPKGTKVDAIEYYGQRIRDLEQQINHVRATIESRVAMPYGFVSYGTISHAHLAAQAAYGKHIQGTTISLAPKPYDIIWSNLVLSKSKRRWNAFVGNVLFVLLSILYVIPNAFIATFLSDISRIAAIWEAFRPSFYGHPQFYAFIQGFLAPVITSIIYLLLPIFMRRLSKWQGDLTKTSRERHVTSKLYFFFVFNNLIVFTVFSVFWELVASIVSLQSQTGKHASPWDVIRSYPLASKLTDSIFGVSSFWVMYLLQRNMGAVLDVFQIASLVWTSFARRFLSPTPRQIIERTAPPAFDYASYYNYFLFYCTIALTFATLQPIILIVAFLHFQIDSWLKKYLLMYVFVTKVESGGAFWRTLFNRFLVATAFSNLIVGIVVWVQFTSSWAWAWLLPLPFLLLLFKWYCSKTFDEEIHFHTKGSDRESVIPSTGNLVKGNDKLRTKFGNPALYKRLIVPMVHKKAQDVLSKVYQGRINSDRMRPSMYGDSLTDIRLMQGDGHAGRRGGLTPLDGQFALVGENELDYSNWRNREEFLAGYAGNEGFGYGFETGGYPTPTLGPHRFAGETMSPSSSRAASPVDFTRGSARSRASEQIHLNLPAYIPPLSPATGSSSSRPNTPKTRAQGYRGSLYGDPQAAPSRSASPYLSDGLRHPAGPPSPGLRPQHQNLQGVSRAASPSHNSDARSTASGHNGHTYQDCGGLSGDANTTQENLRYGGESSGGYVEGFRGRR